MLQTLLSFIIATLVLAFSPGPDNIFVITQSIVYGKKYGLATVCGLMTGCIMHTSIVAFGVSEIIKNNETIFFTIKILGACYLLFLAYKVFKGGSEITINTKAVQKKSVKQLFFTGFWMNVLNPKVTLFFLAFFPSFLFSDVLASVYQFYILGFIFILVSFSVFSSLALLSGSITTKIKEQGKIGKYLKWMQIIVFVSIALLIFM